MANALLEKARGFYSAAQNALAQNPYFSQMDPRDTANALVTAPSQGAAGVGANFLPVVGDAVGLAQDANMYWSDPSSRRMRNYLLTGLGALPFIPAVASLGRSTRNIPTSFGNEVGAIMYHGSPRDFERFDMSAAKTTGGSFNRYGISLSPNRKVAARYASDFSGNDAGRIYTVDSAAQNPLILSPREFHYLQTKVGKIDSGEGLSEVEQVWLEDIFEKHGVKFDATKQHPIDVIRSAGFDAIETPGGGVAEAETLVFNPDLLKIVSKE